MQAGAQEIVAATVHVAGIEGVTHAVAFLGTGPAERVVAAAGVGGDGQHRLAAIAVEHAAGSQVDTVLFAQGALNVVALAGVLGAVEQGIHGLVAFKIMQAQCLAGLDVEHEGFAGADGGAVAGGGGGLVAVGQSHDGGPQR